MLTSSAYVLGLVSGQSQLRSNIQTSILQWWWSSCEDITDCARFICCERYRHSKHALQTNVCFDVFHLPDKALQRQVRVVCSISWEKYRLGVLKQFWRLNVNAKEEKAMKLFLAAVSHFLERGKSLGHSDKMVSSEPLQVSSEPCRSNVQN